MPTESCSIRNFNPATGRISTRSLSRSRRLNSVFAALRRVTSVKSVTSLKRNGVARSPLSVFSQPRELEAQRSTLNAQRSICRARVGRWALDVERWALLSFSGRVKGAWWPPRSSKPPSVGNGRDRFDSYPLRPTRDLMFDGRCLIERPRPQTSNLKSQTSRRG